jgi:hypothetical protein
MGILCLLEGRGHNWFSSFINLSGIGDIIP